MAYTINANAKNVWIRDNEDTRDLSIQTDASSVYLDNGRTLEQELGEGSMVSNVATVDSAMSKVIDGTLDGAYESLVFKGKSLVNLLNHSSLHTSFYSSNENGTITVKNTDNRAWSTMSTNTFYFKTNTTYTFIVYDRKNISKIDIDATKTSTEDRFLYTTRSDVGGTYLRIKIMREDTTIEGSCKLVILEGDYLEEEIPYFTGICDVKMPILRNVGKNLFDGSYEQDKFINEYGTISDSADWCATDFIRVRPNTTYTQNKNIPSSIVYFCFYNEDKQLISTTQPINYNRTFTTPNNCHFIRTSWKYSIDGFDFQFEEGTETTTYEDHKTNILHTPETVTLRSLPSDVRDELNLKTGEYIKRIGENVFDGSDDESITIFNNTFTNVIWFKLLLSNNTTQANSAICDRFKTDAAWGDYEEIQNHENSKNLFVGIKRDRLDTEDVNGFKTWLSQNPITVQYELAEPITTIVEPLTIPFAYENGHVILESGHEGQSLLPTLEYSTVINKTGQIESVAKTIQRQEKQLTMLEQMLIQNIIGLDYSNTVLALNLEINEVM